jgi:putative drug exporter of the RND superfamily
MVTSRPWPWAILSVAVLVVLAIPLFSITLGQPDNGTNPTSQTSRRAYDLMSQGFGVGVNGPLPRWLEPVVPDLQLEGSVAEPAEPERI